MPKQVTKTYTLFTIDELSDKAKAKALDALRVSMMQDFHYSEMINDDITEKIKELGLPITDIRWSHSSSQGDGLAIYGKVDLNEQKLIKTEEAMKKMFIEESLDLVIEKVGPRNYDHYNTMCVDVSHGFEDRTLKVRVFVEKFQEALQEKSRELFRELTRSYDWYFEDAQVIEDCRANDYVFLEDGKIANHLDEK